MTKPPQLDEIIRRIVEVANPQRILMFGSAARGDMGPDSDIDLLVVVEGPVHRGHLAGDIYMGLTGVRQPVDVVVATAGDIEEYGDSPWLVYNWALEEGVEVYVGDGATSPGRSA